MLHASLKESSDRAKRSIAKKLTRFRKIGSLLRRGLRAYSRPSASAYLIRYPRAEAFADVVHDPSPTVCELTIHVTLFFTIKIILSKTGATTSAPQHSPQHESTSRQPLASELLMVEIQNESLDAKKDAKPPHPKKTKFERRASDQIITSKPGSLTNGISSKRNMFLLPALTRPTKYTKRRKQVRITRKCTFLLPWGRGLGGVQRPPQSPKPAGEGRSEQTKRLFFFPEPQSSTENRESQDTLSFHRAHMSSESPPFLNKGKI